MSVNRNVTVPAGKSLWHARSIVDDCALDGLRALARAISPTWFAWLGKRALRETGATGLEPATSGVTGRRSNQLNYAPAREATV